jgi:hypothetical protein
MDESKKREPRLTIRETDKVAAIYDNEEEGASAVVCLGGASDYIANLARTWAEARKKRDA